MSGTFIISQETCASRDISEPRELVCFGSRPWLCYWMLHTLDLVKGVEPSCFEGQLLRSTVGEPPLSGTCIFLIVPLRAYLACDGDGVVSQPPCPVARIAKKVATEGDPSRSYAVKKPFQLLCFSDTD